MLLGNFLWDLPTTGLYMFITQGMNGLQIVGPGSIYDRATGAGYQLVPGKIELALERRAADTTDGGSSARLAPNPRIVKEIALPRIADEVHSEGGSLWVFDGAEISRIDPETNEVVETVRRPYCPMHFTESAAPLVRPLAVLRRGEPVPDGPADRKGVGYRSLAEAHPDRALRRRRDLGIGGPTGFG